MNKNVKCYDAGDRLGLDRYTVLFLNLPTGKGHYEARGMSENPYHPQGVCCWTEAAEGEHLGEEIPFEDLPKDCQRLVLCDASSL